MCKLFSLCPGRWLAAGALLIAAAAGSPAFAGPRDFAVFATRLGGDSETAQPYIDKFATYLETNAGWPKGSAKGRFLPTRKEAVAFIDSKQPGFGVLEPALLLELRNSHKLELLAQVDSTDLNTPALHVVVKNPAIKSLADLQGKQVYTQLADSPRYLSNVVLDGKGAAEKRFQLKPIGQAMKGARAVLRGEADATLLDEEQLAAAKKMEGGAELHAIYTSRPLPPLLVVAFGQSLTDRKALSKALTAMCSTEKGGEICKEMHIRKFVPVTTAVFTEAQKRYEQP